MMLSLHYDANMCNQEVKRRWFADRWTQRWYKAQRWRLSVAVMSVIHVYGGMTVCVSRPVRASMSVQTTWSTTATIS